MTGTAWAQDVHKLYSADRGTTPDHQGWLYLSEPIFGASARSYMGPHVAHLDTTGETKDKAGFFSRLPVARSQFLPLPTLDRATGFDLEFQVQLLNENHKSSARAGFSVIVLASDHHGLELAFWGNEVWVQEDNPIFTHGEGVAIDTSGLQSYRLSFLGDSYQLYRDGLLILAGKARDYSSFGRPYTLPNFIFFGDDTTSAAAHAAVGSMALTLAGGMLTELDAGGDSDDFGLIHWLD